MSVAVASSNTGTSVTAGTAVVVTKPTGLAAGDLMMAFCYGARTTSGWATPSGWTAVVSVSETPGTDGNMSVVAKVADAGDAAASNFTFTPNASTEEKFVALLRITGSSFSAGVASLVVSSGASDLATPFSFTGLTPVSVNSLLLMAGVFATTPAGAGFSSYAIANNNPSWTELFDGATASNGGGIVAQYSLASASYAPETTTGNASFTSTETCGAVLISINEVVSVTISPAVITMVASIQAPAVSGAANVSPAVIAMTATVQAPTVTTAAAKWTNQAKNNSSWANQSKTP